MVCAFTEQDDSTYWPIKLRRKRHHVLRQHQKNSCLRMTGNFGYPFLCLVQYKINIVHSLIPNFWRI